MKYYNHIVYSCIILTGAPVKTVPLKFSTQSGQSGASPKRAVAKKSTSKGQRTDTSTKRKGK